MSISEMVEQILSKHPEISEQEILDRLENERKRTDGFIADDVLIRMIAADLGVEASKNFQAPTISIKDLVPGLGDTTVVGRVVALFPFKIFRAERNGKVASLLIVDRNSLLRVVLWNDKADLVKSGKIGVDQIVRFSHGYTKEDRNGKVGLHLGDRSEIQIDPEDVEAKDYPTISKFVTRIREITQGYRNKRINLTGTVKELFPASDFKREDSSSGKVMRFVLSDGTGETTAVAWNEKVDELKEIVKKGVALQVVNAKVKSAIGKKVEVHINSQTYIETVEKDRFSEISDLTQVSNCVNVEGSVIVKPVSRTVKTSKGERVKVAVFELKDETGRIWVSAWRRHADTVNGLKVGDKVIIKDGYIKKGFGDQLEISTKRTSSIMIVT